MRQTQNSKIKSKLAPSKDKISKRCGKGCGSAGPPPPRDDEEGSPPVAQENTSKAPAAASLRSPLAPRASTSLPADHPATRAALFSGTLRPFRGRCLHLLRLTDTSGVNGFRTVALERNIIFAKPSLNQGLYVPTWTDSHPLPPTHPDPHFTSM